MLNIKDKSTGQAIESNAALLARIMKPGQSSPKIEPREPEVFYCDDMPTGTGWYCCNSLTGETRRYINKGPKTCQ